MVKQLLTASPVTTGATSSTDLDTRRLSRLTVAWKLAATVTTTDLTLNDLTAYDELGNLLTVALPAESTTAAASDGANVVALKTYILRGVERVAVTAKNNNGATKNLTIDVFGEYAGRGA